MLVLSRKKGQSILIGEGIELTILEVEGDTIKIGIAAPRDVQILRSELLTSVKESNKESVGLPHALDFSDLSDVLQKKSQK